MNLHEQVISLHLFRSLNSFNNILQFQCSGLIQFSLDLFLGTGWFLLSNSPQLRARTGKLRACDSPSSLIFCLAQQTGSSLGNTETLKCISSVLPPGSPRHCEGKKIEKDKLRLHWGPGRIPPSPHRAPAAALACSPRPSRASRRDPSLQGHLG